MRAERDPCVVRSVRRRRLRVREDAGGRSGLTSVELIVAMFMLLVALSAFAGLVTSTARQRTIIRENAAAAEGAQNVLETMRNADFRELFALYNADPDDDPGGAGTAPGSSFVVPGLQQANGGALVGNVIFPAVDAGVPGTPDWQLREDMVHFRLGMPRDLDWDGRVDALDHAENYDVLPVAIHIAWTGRVGQRQYFAYSQFTDFDR